MTKLLRIIALMIGTLGGAAHAQTVTYIHTDALGTPIAKTDATGNVIETSEYTPHGELLNRADGDGPGYAGHVEDAATGMTYMLQRYYDPVIGRFLSVDPVAARPIGDNFNRYWYANNNPYRFTDPDGREAGGGYATGQYMMDMTTDADSAKIGLAAAGAVYGGAALYAAGVSGATIVGGIKALGSMIRQEIRSETKVKIEKGETRNSPEQIRTSTSPKEAQANLRSNGYTRAESKDGKAVVMSKGEKSYTFYSEAKSTGGPTAEVKVAGETQVKIRFDENIK